MIKKKQIKLLNYLSVDLRWLRITVSAVILLGLTLLTSYGQSIVIGPYLQNVTTNAVTVIWWTDFSTAGKTTRVEYGAGLGNFCNAVQTEESSFSAYSYCYKQQAVITGLTMGMEYNYKVVSDNSSSSTNTFSIAPGRNENIHFAVMGDGRNESSDIIARHKMVFTKAFVYGADFIVYGGDMVHYGSSTTPQLRHKVVQFVVH